MRKLEIKDAEAFKVAIQDEIRRSADARYDHRLHGLLLACSGMSCGDIAKHLGHGIRTIQYWLRKFESSGFAGLREEARSGRPASLSERMLKEIGQDLRQDPRKLGHSQGVWDGKLLHHHIGMKYGVELGVRQCQRLFHKLRFRLRKPRPVIAKADPEAQKAFKKTPAARAKKGH
ncbi:MAG TPA: winged helix-turn-helix domain-containing protein [Acidobacteriota bacterium]|nr:winged helix-turn-helix domain-containing protein [Acidobacteriota bacterium]HNT18073.1 winged helix-turn-helix domain-containing protein [Acidobacteriota bacterium]